MSERVWHAAQSRSVACARVHLTTHCVGHAHTQPHVLLLLFFAYLSWRFLGGAPPPCTSPLDGPPGCPPVVAAPSDVDVVTVALAPSCVNAAAVASLNRNLAPQRLFVVTHRNESCPFFTGLAPNVRCLVDDTVMPGARVPRPADSGRLCLNREECALTPLHAAGLTRSLIAGVLQKLYGASHGALGDARCAPVWQQRALHPLVLHPFIASLHCALRCRTSDFKRGTGYAGRDTVGWYHQQVRPIAVCVLIDGVQ